jgi:DNA polymerase III delta prime subunit
MSSEIYKQACELIESSNLASRHTFYQLKHFVLGKEITTQAKMQKCLREIDARKSSIKSMVLGIEEAEDEAKVLDLKMAVLEKKKEKNELHKEYKSIQKRKLTRKKAMLLDTIGEMRKKLLETEEEMSFFLSAYRQLEKIEPLRRHDDPEANAHYWDENFAQELQLRLLLQKPLDLELVKCILAMDSASPTRKEMIGILEQIQTRALVAGERAKISTKETNNE